MKRRGFSKKEAALLCEAQGPEDGLDPRYYFRSQTKKNFDRKTFQLCKQVGRALSLALADTGHPLLSQLTVGQVQPAPDASRLLVLLHPIIHDPAPSLDLVQEALSSNASLLRSQAAREINRKRTPSLTFRYVPQEEGLV